jgi:two-component system phosphate regulon sensor histidine kinase PhoR
VTRNTLRTIIVLAVISIAGTIFTQVYWVRKAFDLKENQFNHDVEAALIQVANQIIQINKTPSPRNNPVMQMSTNYFVVLTNSPIDQTTLGFLIKTEFERRNIKADYEYALYDCADQCMKAAEFVSMKNNRLQASLTQMPAWKNDGYYFGVQFPYIEANLISQMGIWGFSSAVMLMVIVFFAYTLFVILRQKRLSEIQKDFINNMTHEFKTPLSTITISSEVLRDPKIISTPERLLNYATIIQNESQRLKQHVERVLQMARLEKSDVGLKKERLNIHDLIQEAVQNISVSLQSKGGQVHLELNAKESFASVDKLHFTNVLFNLLDNAIKYNKQSPELLIRTSDSAKQISVEVKDNGIGMSADHLKKIFNRFYRVPTGNIHDVKGFGLGLNYVKLIVEAHKGKVTVESKPGEGSVFRITIPLS